jgi:hypothetical protein
MQFSARSNLPILVVRRYVQSLKHTATLKRDRMGSRGLLAIDKAPARVRNVAMAGTSDGANNWQGQQQQQQHERTDLVHVPTGRSLARTMGVGVYYTPSVVDAPLVRPSCHTTQPPKLQPTSCWNAAALIAATGRCCWRRCWHRALAATAEAVLPLRPRMLLLLLLLLRRRWRRRLWQRLTFLAVIHTVCAFHQHPAANEIVVTLCCVLLD